MKSFYKLPGKKWFIGPLMFLVGLTSCRETPRMASGTSHMRLTDEKVIDYNRGIVKMEEQEISDFIGRYQWDMKQTSTGLRYLIHRNGTGRSAEIGMVAHFLYTVKLLDGTLVYTSDSLGMKSIVIGRGGAEPGVEEGLLLLREGDRAKFIIPSYLAHGVLGDQKEIPPGATLVYDLNLVELESQKK